MQQSNAPQVAGATVDPNDAQHIIDAFKKVIDDTQLLPACADLIRRGEEIADLLNQYGHDLFKVAPQLAAYTEFMTNNNDYIFGEASGSAKELITIILRDANRYKHLAHTLQNSTAADSKKEYKSNPAIPEPILRKATHELIKLYEGKTKTSVGYAKPLLTKEQKKQPFVVFIEACLKQIDPSMVYERAVTAINKVRRDLKSGSMQQQLAPVTPSSATGGGQQPPP